jgi:radical SAM protein with 4Fe4S-binding SPASM domain
MCLIRDRKQELPALMDMALFRRLLSQFAGAEELHLQGLGEPLLHPMFFDMVSFAAGRGMRVSTNSNLTLLDPGQAEACVRSGLAWMRVSLDGATRGTYESIRTGSRFENVLRNLDLLSATKKRLGSEHPHIYLVMVVMRSNLGELPALVRLANRYAVEQIFVQNLCSDVADPETQERQMTEFFARESLQGEDPGLVKKMFQEALSLSRGFNMELRLPPLLSGFDGIAQHGRDRCDWPWRSAYVTYDGTAVPCCMIGLPERASMGSMAREGVPAVWNGEAYRRFRSQLDSDDPPSFCRSCSLYRGMF